MAYQQRRSEAPVDAWVVVVCRSLTTAKRVFERSEWRMTNDGDPGLGLWMSFAEGMRPAVHSD